MSETCRRWLLLLHLCPTITALSCPAHAEALTIRYAYTGREADAGGLIYYRSRYYDPASGRLLQRDKIGLGGGINDYAYVGGNPAMARDPSGAAASSPGPASLEVLGGNFTVGIMDHGVVPAYYGSLTPTERDYESGLSGSLALLGGALLAATLAPYVLLYQGPIALAGGAPASMRLLPEKFRIYANGTVEGAARDAGHALAWKVLPGGSGRAVAGNQIVQTSVARAPVPKGTAVTMLAPGKVMTSDVALIMEADQLGRVPLSPAQIELLEGAITYLPLPTAQYPNYLVGTPDKLFMMKNSISVGLATHLSRILRPNMGCVSITISTLCE